jgi:Cu-processing system permease protein
MNLRSDVNAWRLCARHERALAARSRWIQAFAVLFASLSIGVAWSGYILSGGGGVQDFARTTASLVQLMLLMVPLAALVFGVQALAGDAGGSQILFAQPVPRWVILLGTITGIFEALFTAELIGFAAAGFVIFSFAGDEGLSAFLLLIAGAAFTTLVFLGIAARIAVGSTGRRARALGLALVAWFGLVLFYDIVLLGAATMLKSGYASRLLVAGVVLNPVDALRTGLLIAAEGTAAFGTASLTFFRITGGTAAGFTWLAISIAAWIVLTILWAARKLGRIDI